MASIDAVIFKFQTMDSRHAHRASLSASKSIRSVIGEGWRPTGTLAVPKPVTGGTASDYLKPFPEFRNQCSQ